MRTHKDNQSGFGTIELVLIIAVVVLLGVVGWLVYKNDHKTTTASVATTSSTRPATSATTKKTTTPTSTTTTPSNPYSGWKSDCDSQSSTCLYYPSTWTAQTGLGNQGYDISTANGDVSVGEYPEPSNCSASSQPGETNQLYVVSVNSVTSSSLSLDVVGGYFNNQLNGSPRYNPYYILTSTANVSKYGVKTGSTVTFPDAWTCYDYGVISGEASSQPAGSGDYNSTTQDAISWFSTSDAATSLQILQSVYKD
ncbi:MAG TPA: hypothetical protein VMR34_04015 [Candidatus Saccharimonadales bacterium]|nr:hypothetical protein [Candidatus Saccharimonadales bacterium]